MKKQSGSTTLTAEQRREIIGMKFEVFLRTCGRIEAALSTYLHICPYT